MIFPYLYFLDASQKVNTRLKFFSGIKERCFDKVCKISSGKSVKYVLKKKLNFLQRRILATQNLIFISLNAIVRSGRSLGS